MAGDIRIEEHLIVVSPQAHAKASAIADTADEQGAHVIHRFGPRVMITELPKDIERVRSALGDAEVAAHPNELSSQATKDLDPIGALGLAAFQLRQSPEYISAKASRSYDNVCAKAGGGMPILQTVGKIGLLSNCKWHGQYLEKRRIIPSGKRDARRIQSPG